MRKSLRRRQPGAEASAEARKGRPSAGSLAQLRAFFPFPVNLQGLALREKTLNVGLREAGVPEE
jgi:hypothetical protein